MTNLFRFEFRKLFRARVFYVCGAVLVVMLLVLMGTEKITVVISSEMLGVSPEELLYDSPEDQQMMAGMGLFLGARSGLAWMLNALTSSFTVMVFGAFVATFFLGDYGNRTVHHILTKGYSRTEIFFAKYLTCLAGSLIYATILMLCAFIFGSLFFTVGKSFSLRFVALILTQFLIVAAFNAMFCFFSALSFKVAPALILSIAIPVAMPLILTVADLLIQWQAISGEETLESWQILSSYWLNGLLSGVSTTGASDADMIRALVGAPLYIAVFTAGGYLLARRKEV